jgi:hypothetical protein
MPAKAVAKRISADKQADFTETFKQLRAILVPYARKKMRVVQDTPDHYYIETEFPVYRGKRVMFAAVRMGKSYVSYHLLPLYTNPAMQASLSPELKKRQQGKACLNFAKPDKKLFAELSKLTEEGLECFRKLAAKS